MLEASGDQDQTEESVMLSANGVALVCSDMMRAPDGVTP